jgi:hypothetical protein
VRLILEEVWKYPQSAYTEWKTIDETERKNLVHPALLWPVFAFGAKCVEEECQNWAVDQLHDDEGEGILPPFRVGFGVILKECDKEREARCYLVKRTG